MHFPWGEEEGGEIAQPWKFLHPSCEDPNVDPDIHLIKIGTDHMEIGEEKKFSLWFYARFVRSVQLRWFFCHNADMYWITWWSYMYNKELQILMTVMTWIDK